MTYTVVLNERENKVLTALATKNNILPEVYINNIVKVWLEDKIRGFYRKKVSALVVNDLENLLGQVDETKI